MCESFSAARNGEIVVALVDGVETTLKRFYNEAGDQVPTATGECFDAADLCAEGGGEHSRQAVGCAAQVLIVPVSS